MSTNPYEPPPSAKEPPLSFGETTGDERTWGMLAHLSGLIAMLLGGFTFLGPLIVWLIKKDQSAFVADQAKEALNFQIAVFIVLLVSALSMFFCIGFILVPVVVIGAIIYSIIGAMEANKGVAYRYPYTFRLIS
jgi:uncharacterized Tic20 family protein